MCGQSTLEEQAVDSVMEQLDIALPDNLELDTSRVGEDVAYAESVNPGETVSFYYTAGSEVGNRTVLVVKVDGEGLEGLTLERDGGYRRYLDRFISGQIQIVKPFIQSNGSPYHSNSTEKRVRFDDAGVALLASLSGEQLADLYGRYVAVEGIGTKFDGNTGEVVVELPEVTSKFISSDKGLNTLRIQNKDGVELRLHQYGDGSIGLVNDLTGFNTTSPTPENLRDELVKLLA